MLWRIILGYPLGNTMHILPSIMVNIIGGEGFTGSPEYEGINDVLLHDNTYIHIYGKLQTKPGRKMGHITILSHEKQDLIYNANRVKQLLSVVSR
jgi:5-(carboxyamino)imidazole ribonucleotide synthase